MLTGKNHCRRCPAMVFSCFSRRLCVGTAPRAALAAHGIALTSTLLLALEELQPHDVTLGAMMLANLVVE